MPKTESDSLAGMNWKERITIARMRRGLKKAEFARLAKVSGPTVTDWEGPKTKMIEGDKLVRISRILQVTPEWIMAGEGAPEDDATLTVAEFAWVYRHASDEGKSFLRNTIRVVKDTFVPPDPHKRRST